MRELADEPDGVGDQVAAPIVLVAASRRVERMKEPLPHADSGAGERIEKRRLAGVRVSRERDCGKRRRLAPGAHHAAVSLHAGQPASQRRDPVASQAAVGLDLRLAWAPCADAAVHAAGAEALEMGPQPPHPGEVVLELRQLDLELALRRVRMVGEDVEDDGRAIDHRHVERGLEVALLAWSELVVAGDEVRAIALDLRLELRELPAPEVTVRIGLRPHLDELARGGDARCSEELLELRERVGAVDRARGDADRERALARPGISDSRSVLHRIESRPRGGAIRDTLRAA